MSQDPRVFIHRNPAAVGVPFHPRLRPLAAAYARLLPRVVARELRRDPGALVVVASLLDESLDGLEAGGTNTTARLAASPADQRLAVEEAFRMADGWHRVLPRELVDRFVRHGVDLPAVHRWDLHYPLLAMVDFLQKMDALLERTPSRLVAVGHPVHVGLAGRLAAARSVPFRGRPLRLAALADRVLAAGTGRGRRSGILPPAPAPDRPVTLFITHGPSDARNAAAVAAELERRGILRPHVLSLAPSAASVLREAGVPHEDAVARPPAPAPEVRNLRRAWADLQATPGLRTVFTHEGVDLLDPWARDLLRRSVLQRFPRALSTAAGAEAVLDRLRPRVLVTGFDPGTDSQVYVRVARRRGVRTVSIQDGTLVHADLMGLTADELCAADEETAQAVQAGGVRPDRVHVTGQPRHDAAPVLPGADEGLRDRLGVPPDHRVALLFAATGMDSASQASQKQRYEDLVVGHFSQRPDWTLLVKLHPQDDGRVSRRVLERHRARNVRVLHGPDAGHLMPLADLVLCAATSTTAVEAVQAGKPLMVLDLDGEHPMQELVDAGVARAARRTEAFAADVEATLHDEDAEAARETYARRHGPRTGATARVADVLERPASRAREAHA